MASQFGVQATGVVTAAAWAAGCSFALMKITEGLIGIRVVQEVETQGLDLSTHGESGYNVAFGGTTQ
jgi:Amt family ammonium transporter